MRTEVLAALHASPAPQACIIPPGASVGTATGRLTQSTAVVVGGVEMWTAASGDRLRLLRHAVVRALRRSPLWSLPRADVDKRRVILSTEPRAAHSTRSPQQSWKAGSVDVQPAPRDPEAARSEPSEGEEGPRSAQLGLARRSRSSLSTRWSISGLFLRTVWTFSTA